jgi:hypothetical protein
MLDKLLMHSLASPTALERCALIARRDDRGYSREAVISLGAWDNYLVPDEGRAHERQVTVRRFASNPEANRHDLEYWRQIPPADRVLYAWRLSVEQWQLAGHSADEPRLCRSVARVTRR